jgi:ribosome production factor 1
MATPSSSSAAAAAPPPWIRAPAAALGSIRNKHKRAEAVAKARLLKARTKSERRKRERELEAGDADGGAARKAARPAPRTTEGARLQDDTLVQPGDDEVARDEDEDEFAAIWGGREAPKVMVTTQRYPSGKVFPLISELLRCVPRAFYYRRGRFELKRVCDFASAKGFTHLLVLTEHLKRPSGLIVVKLPLGPTLAFKLRSTVMAGDIKGHGASTDHAPEIILNNFSTRLGRRVGRALGSLFPHAPEFAGRQVVTFHNQRDFVFFRHHRYIFEGLPEDAAGGAEKEGGGGGGGGAGDGDSDAAPGPLSRLDEKKAAKRKAKADEARARQVRRATRSGGTVSVRMQELGPRFTLKLKYILAGTFDTRFGEYEYLRRFNPETQKLKFAL